MPDATLYWYERNADAYADATWGIDLSPQRRRFMAQLPAGGRILDAGCGSGRDAHAFLQHGFRVDARDASQQLASIAAKRLGLPVRVQDIRQLEDCNCFDGIWLSAVLLHIPHPEVAGVLQRLAHALTPDGIIHLSVKDGDGHRTEGGRTFFDWTISKLVQVIHQTGKLRINEAWSEPDSQRPIRWVHILARRSRP